MYLMSIKPNIQYYFFILLPIGGEERAILFKSDTLGNNSLYFYYAFLDCKNT